jgi:hypothetical protein
MPRMQTSTAAVPSEAIDETPLQEFERALQARFPNREVRRYEMPKSVKEARAVYFVEVNSRDEIMAGIYADAVMEPAERSSHRLTAQAVRRETMRASIVGLVSRADPPTYRQANHAGVAFHELDDWAAKATTALFTYYNEFNGIQDAELIEGLMGARTIGTPVLPTNGIPEHARAAK